MRRTAWIAAIVAVVAAGCGGGGGTSGGFDEGPLYWGVPFTSTTLTTGMIVGLRNLDADATAATLQGYKPDGTPYPGPVLVHLDGDDEARFALSDALGGATPEGGWILASTPSRAVHVYLVDRIDAKLAEEAVRAIPLPDLGAPLLPFHTGVNVTTETTEIQIANVTGTPVTVTVTPYETAPVPTDPPIVGPDVLVSLGAFESKLFLPADLTGTPFTSGSLQLTGATPFFAAGAEDLAFDPPQVSPEIRLVEVALSFGRVPADVSDFFDFVMIARNDTGDPAGVTLVGIHDPDGFPVLSSPRTVQVPPHVSRTFTTTDPPFDDLFGDVLLSPFVREVHMQIQVPAGVDLAFRQFDPVVLAYNATIRPMPAAFVVDAMDVLTNPENLPDVHTVATILNPSNASIDVVVTALVPEPDGFDASPHPIGTFTVPPDGLVDFSPDGLEFLDRDFLPTPYVGLRFASSASFAVTGTRERRSVFGVLTSLSPLVVRPHESAQ